ncbi:hypothetical protein D3C72_1854650 [compost metagenome]
MDLLLAAVGLGHRGIHHLDHHGRDVQTRAVTFDERDDGLVRHIQGHVGIDGDLLAFGGHRDVLVGGHGWLSPGESETGSAAVAKPSKAGSF